MSNETAPAPKPKRRGCLAAFYLLMMLIAAGAALYVWSMRDPAPVKEHEFGNPSSGKRVLIATQNTNFRLQLTDRLAEGLRAEGCYVWVTDVQLLPQTSLDSFSAVVILDTVRYWRVHENTEAILKQENAGEKVIVVPCAGDAEFKLKADGVDAITAASPGGDIPGLKDRILSAVRKRFLPEEEEEPPAAAKPTPERSVGPEPAKTESNSMPEDLAPPEMITDQE